MERARREDACRPRTPERLSPSAARAPARAPALLRLLHGEPLALVRNAPELLFVSLMLSAIQMGEFLEGGASRARGNGLRAVAFSLFLLVGVVAAMTYGVYVQALRTIGAYGAERWVTFESNVFSLGVVLAASATALGTLAELTRDRRRPCPRTQTSS